MPTRSPSSTARAPTNPIPVSSASMESEGPRPTKGSSPKVAA